MRAVAADVRDDNLLAKRFVRLGVMMAPDRVHRAAGRNAPHGDVTGVPALGLCLGGRLIFDRQRTRNNCMYTDLAAITASVHWTIIGKGPGITKPARCGCPSAPVSLKQRVALRDLFG